MWSIPARRPCCAANETLRDATKRSAALARRGKRRARAKRLDIGRDVQRLDIGELADPVLLAPGEESADGGHVGRAGVPVADGRGEEFGEAAGRAFAGIGDDAGHHTTTTAWSRMETRAARLRVSWPVGSGSVSGASLGMGLA